MLFNIIYNVPLFFGGTMKELFFLFLILVWSLLMFQYFTEPPAAGPHGPGGNKYDSDYVIVEPT